MSNLDSNKSSQLIRQLKKSFTTQEQQAKLIISHINKSPFKYIISGDFNNTSYSYIYRLLKSNLVDLLRKLVTDLQYIFVQVLSFKN